MRIREYNLLEWIVSKEMRTEIVSKSRHLSGWKLHFSYQQNGQSGIPYIWGWQRSQIGNSPNFKGVYLRAQMELDKKIARKWAFREQ